MNTHPSDDDLLHIHVQERRHLENQLDQAVRILAGRAAIRGGIGIVVARHSPNHFTAQLHPDIPFGMIMEKQEWQ